MKNSIEQSIKAFVSPIILKVTTFILAVAITFFSTSSFSQSKIITTMADNSANQSQDSQQTLVKLTTSMGDIVLELYPDKAPKTVANFLNYVSEGFYSQTIFHRVIDGFMVQGGGMDANLSQKPTNHPIENEADNDLTNKVGSVAMARTNQPHSASSQFFINVNNNDFLNHQNKTERGWGYTVFGEVIEGIEVVNKIKGVATHMFKGYQDVPKTPVIIEKAEVVTTK